MAGAVVLLVARTAGLSPLLLLLFGIGEVAAAIGLWRLRAWGFFVALSVLALNALLNMIEGDLVSVVAMVLLIAYLVKKSYLFH